MSKYNYRTGNVERPSSHFGMKVAALGIGAFIGFYMGAMVVIGQIQASVQPIVMQGSDSSLSVRQPDEPALTLGSTTSSPADLQPAGGYNAAQRTERPQP